MSKPRKPELLLATWPDQPNARYFGHADYPNHVDGCDSFWLSLRATRANDESSWMDEEVRAFSDIGLYCWFGDTGILQFYFAIHDVHNMNLSEAEARIKALRWLQKQMPEGIRHRNADTFRAALMDIFAAIGVKRAIEYRHMVPSNKSTFTPVYDAIDVIGKEFDKRYARIKKEV